MLAFKTSRRTILATGVAMLTICKSKAAPVAIPLEVGVDINSEVRTFGPVLKTKPPEARRSERIPTAGPPGTPGKGGTTIEMKQADGSIIRVGPVVENVSSAPATGTFGGFQIQWPQDQNSVDVRHLLDAEAQIAPRLASEGASFNLTPALLNQICRNNSLWPMRRVDAPVVLFGIRGARSAASADWTASVPITLHTPNHFDNCCLIGVWYRGSGHVESLRVFPGSTVPNARYMASQASSHGQVSNLAPTGLHRFAVGTHRGLQGAFKQALVYPAHRLPKRTYAQQGASVLQFTNDVNEFSWPDLWSSEGLASLGNDIHPALTPAGDLKYSSAGCQVVQGSQTSADQKAAGFWAAFRDAAELATPPSPRQDNLPYDYLLLSGREAWLTSLASPTQMTLLERLRFGSVPTPIGVGAPGTLGGIKIREIQKALIAKCRMPGAFRNRVSAFRHVDTIGVDDKFFGETMRLVLAWQITHRDYADGIVDHAMLKELFNV